MANADSAGADRGAAGASEAADLAVPRLSSPSSLAVLESSDKNLCLQRS